jgi:hypothetical protein
MRLGSPVTISARSIASDCFVTARLPIHRAAFHGDLIAGAINVLF